jgi:hypothetical protein
MADKYPGTNLFPKDFSQEDANKATLDLLKKINTEAGSSQASFASVDASLASILAMISALDIDQGANSNGDYVVFPNKLCLCWQESGLNSNGAEWNVFGSSAGITYQGGAVWTVPKSYAVAPRVWGGGGAGSIKLTVYNPTTSQANYQVKTKSSESIQCYLFAIGYVS